MEGMTELVFVYHCIFAHHHSDWTSFHLDYVSANPLDRVDLVRPYGDDGASCQYIIYNCGSDDAVIPTMKDRYRTHQQQGFNRIIGLRDIYGTRYFDIYKAGHRQIEWAKVKAMIADLEKTVSMVDASGVMAIRFSIMEIEAWILAMPKLLGEVFPNLSCEQLSALDPEVAYVHPYDELNALVPYKKNFGSVEGIFSHITQEHLDDLLQSGKCASFVRFYRCLFDEG